MTDKNKHAELVDKCFDARLQLRFSDMITDSEADRIAVKIIKYARKHKVKIHSGITGDTVDYDVAIKHHGGKV